MVLPLLVHRDRGRTADEKGELDKENRNLRNDLAQARADAATTSNRIETTAMREQKDRHEAELKRDKESYDARIEQQRLHFENRLSEQRGGYEHPK